MTAYGKESSTYRLDRLDLVTINEVLRKIQSDISEALAVSQNPDLKGRSLKNLGKSQKPGDAVTRAELDAHNHKLAELEEHNYSSLIGRPADDEFTYLKQKATIKNEDRVLIYDQSSRKYKWIDARLVIRPDDITTLVNSVAADIPMPLANTYYNGPSISLTEGRWVVIGGITVATPPSAGRSVAAKLWDGAAAVYHSGEAFGVVTAAGSAVSISLCATMIVLSADAPKTIEISAACTIIDAIIKAATVYNGSGNNASSILGMRIGPST